MQIDLFQPTGEVREKCGELRKSRRTSSSAASGNGNCGSPHFPFSEVRRSAGSSHSHYAAGSRRRTAEPEEKDVASQIRHAMAERHELQIALAEVLECEEETEKEMRPYQAAFSEAHRRLENAWADSDSTTETRLALYTARMWAGHARHPYRVKLEDITGWRKRVEHELRACNAVIERLTGKKGRKAA